MKKIIYFLILSVCLVGCSQKAEQQAKVYGRYVPERKDDFAWENEYAAFRMYGPALAPENPSNGVDLWLKASPELVVDSFYYREHVLGLPYHINYGKGLDCYKVGHTAGCGGLVVVSEPEHKLNIGGPYSSWEVLEQTPEKFVFRLHYDSLSIDETQVEADVTITAEAGNLLNKAEVVLHTDAKIRLPKMYVGGGIFLHENDGQAWSNKEVGAIAYAENALSDKNAAQMNLDYNGSTSQGTSYIAVVTPGATFFDILGENDFTYVSAREYEMGDTLTYYFGACWSEWSDGEKAFATDEDWFAAVEEAAK